MRTVSILIPFILCNALAACSSSSGTGTIAGNPPPTTISITMASAPALVAFREWTTADDTTWQTATMVTPTSFTAQVHGPYLVTVVCENVTTSDTWETWQVGEGLKDSTDLVAPCNPAPALDTVNGRMDPAGHVAFGPQTATADPNGNFQLAVPSGTYDLIAVTAADLAIQRADVISASNVSLNTIDVAPPAGKALVSTAFTSDTDPADGETLSLSVDLMTAGTPMGANLYQGAIDTAKIAPASALISTDTQIVSLSAVSTGTGTATSTPPVFTRTLQREYTQGDDTVLTLAAGIHDLQWTLDAGRMSVISDGSDDGDFAMAVATGFSTDGSKTARYDYIASGNFTGDTSVGRFIIDTNIPGYQPQWAININRAYFRTLTTQGTGQNGDVSFDTVSDSVNTVAAVTP